jgi:hypothetical protein
VVPSSIVSKKSDSAIAAGGPVEIEDVVQFFISVNRCCLSQEDVIPNIALITLIIKHDINRRLCSLLS